MSVLISRNALLDAMPKNDELLSVDVRRIICESPIIDAEPARHGRWVKSGYACGESEWTCTICGNKEWRTSTSRLKFCPFCGAKMDGGEQNAAN